MNELIIRSEKQIIITIVPGGFQITTDTVMHSIRLISDTPLPTDRVKRKYKKRGRPKQKNKPAKESKKSLKLEWKDLLKQHPEDAVRDYIVDQHLSKNEIILEFCRRAREAGVTDEECDPDTLRARAYGIIHPYFERLKKLGKGGKK